MKWDKSNVEHLKSPIILSALTHVCRCWIIINRSTKYAAKSVCHNKFDLELRCFFSSSSLNGSITCCFECAFLLAAAPICLSYIKAKRDHTVRDHSFPSSLKFVDFASNSGCDWINKEILIMKLMALVEDGQQQQNPDFELNRSFEYQFENTIS